MGLITDKVDTRLGSIVVRSGGPDDAPVLVYFHSAAGEGEAFTLLDALATDHRVVAPMFPGFDASEGLEEIDDMEDAVFHLIDLWDRLDLGAPVVAGLSLGGWLALELATRYPERVGGLALINPVGLHFDDAPIADIFGRSPGLLAEDFFADQQHPLAQMMHAVSEFEADIATAGEIPFEMLEPYVTRLAATARLGWNPYLHNPKLAGRLWRISCPTVVIRATEDTLVPAEHARYYANHIEGAALIEVPGLAHLAPIEDPAPVAAAIRKVLP